VAIDAASRFGHVSRSILALAAAVSVLGLGGCGWLGASGASHTKPDAFLLRGHVAVLASPTDPRPDGAACASTVPDIVTGSPVRVTDPAGKVLGTGALGDGVVAHAANGPSCDFPFQVPHIAGGVASYDITVGGRPPQRFDAKELRENAAAIITINV
jgi:hypothetical protein